MKPAPSSHSVSNVALIVITSLNLGLFLQIGGCSPNGVLGDAGDGLMQTSISQRKMETTEQMKKHISYVSCEPARDRYFAKAVSPTKGILAPSVR